MANSMLSIASPTLKSIITDYPIEFPRYQRNKAWKDVDKFKLCISVFKRYPIGSIVVKDIDEEGDVKKWILDGRQRYETLMDMQNPESVYIWAKKCCNLKDRMTTDMVRESVYEYVGEYLGYDVDNSDQCIKDLADVVCYVHPMKKRNECGSYESGFRTPFIFKDYRAKYTKGSGKCLDADPRMLLGWILGSNLTKKDLNDLTVDTIIEAYDNADDNLRDGVIEKEKGIIKSLKAVKILQTIMTQNELSLITLSKECNPSDEMKIFEIINTAGQGLSNAQVRSAKKVWNYPVKDVPDDDPVHKYTEKLYTAYELTMAEEYVMWDYAATFIDRLNESTDVVLGSKYRTMEYSNTSSKDKLELGFKLLSAGFMNSVTKEKIDELPATITNWSVDCRELATDMNDVCQMLIKKDGVFKNMEQYGVNILSMGQNLAICYLIMAVRRWNHYEKATSGQKNTSFISDMRMLLDLFVYEYVNDMWKGSGDSRLSSILRSDFDTVCKKVNENEWNELIDRAYSYNEFPSSRRTNDKLNVLTYYFTALRDVKIRVNRGEMVHIDHIIPKAQFVDNTDPEYMKFKDSLYNYALLPPELNKDKSDWITSLQEHSIKSVCDFETLDIERLDEIKSAADIPKLKEMRSKIPEEVKARRKEYVDCQKFWTIH